MSIQIFIQAKYSLLINLYLKKKADEELYFYEQNVINGLLAYLKTKDDVIYCFFINFKN
jgi:hypothetical protein